MMGYFSDLADFDSYMENISRYLDFAETVEEWTKLCLLIDLAQHRKECFVVRHKISTNTRMSSQDGVTPRYSRLREDVQGYIGRLKAPEMLRNFGPKPMSDHLTDHNWFFSLSTRHPTNLKVNFN